MSQFVFKIGPLPQARNGENAYFVFPGREGAAAFTATSDTEGLTAVRAAYPDEDLECEPDLECAGQTHAIRSGIVSLERAHAIGLMTLEIALPDHFRNVRRSGVIYQWGIAAGDYWRAKPWQSRFAQSIINLDFTNGVGASKLAMILGRDHDPKGLATFSDWTSLGEVSALTDKSNDNSASTLSTLGVIFEHATPSFAVHGMRRGYNLERLPMPLKLAAGTRERVDDMDLLILACAMRGIVALGEASAETLASVSVEDLSAQVRVTIANDP